LRSNSEGYALHSFECECYCWRRFAIHRTIASGKKNGDRPFDITLIGKDIIHRAKTGGKDYGEDCFLPSRIVGVRSNYEVDIFEEVFGDLPTSRQTTFW